MPLVFRPASVLDIPLLQSLADRIWRTCYVRMISAEQIDYMLGWMYSAGAIAAELDAGVLWSITELDGAPIGYLSVVLESAARAELSKLYLLPEHHGKGCGQAMIAHAMATAAALGRRELRLRVNKANARALRSYEQAGFRLVESVVAEIGGGFVMDDYVLSRTL